MWTLDKLISPKHSGAMLCRFHDVSGVGEVIFIAFGNLGFYVPAFMSLSVVFVGENMKRIVLRLGVLLGLLVVTVPAVGADLERSFLDVFAVAEPPNALYGQHKPVRSCGSLKELSLEDTVITEAIEAEKTETSPVICKITALVKRSEADDPIRVWVDLPTTEWNGRFMGVGGGGYAGGSRQGMQMHHPAGFATATTDAGPRTQQPDRDVKNGEFALGVNGKLDWRAVRNFAHRGVHVMSVTGKAITAAYYGKPAGYAYFSGCSRGGGQAMMEAQKYPTDYDGILAGAPAINWAKYGAGRLWGQLHMELTKNFVPECKLNAVTEAVIEACDTLDGVKDSVIDNPRRCAYDPKQFVGTNTSECGEFTLADADIVNKIWKGPHRKNGSSMWYGFERGTSLEILQSTEKNAETGEWQTSSKWNDYFLSWHRYFLAQDPNLQIASFTQEQFEDFWDQSVEQYSRVWSADSPDLSALKNAGGKVLMWHGEADTYIPPKGSIDYHNRVEKHFGSASEAQSVYRLFMAPGLGHCLGGNGPAPFAALDALIDWVEKDKAPERLLAVKRDAKTGEIIRSRPLCLYPKVARYKGTGSTDRAESFECAANY